jgi:hypothetical protein
MTPPREDMNTLIRRAAGYPPAGATPPPTVIGDLGIGRGGSALPMRPAPPSMSALIRATCAERRERVRELVIDHAGRPWVG